MYSNFSYKLLKFLAIYQIIEETSTIKMHPVELKYIALLLLEY